MNAYAVVALITLLGLASWDRMPQRFAAWCIGLRLRWLKWREGRWTPPTPDMDGGNR